MEFVTFCFLLLSNLLTIKKIKRKLNYLSTFTVVWAIIVGFAKIRLFGLNETSWKAYLVADLGAVFFSLAYLTVINSKVKSRNKYGNSRPISKNGNTSNYILDDLRSLKEKELINYPLFLIIFALVFAFQMVLLRRALAILSTGTLSSIHYAIRHTGETGILVNNTENLINTIFAQPFVYAIIPISLIALFGKIKHYKIIFALTTVSSVVYFITHAGRIIIIDYIVYILFLLSAFEIVISKRTKRIILLLILFALGGVILATASRRGLVFSMEFIRDTFLREVYDYFAIPLPQMSYWMDRIQSSRTYTYGLGFFNGIIELPLRVIDRLGYNIRGYEDLIAPLGYPERYYTHAAYYDRSYNAFVTAFFFFFSDFRYAGVALGSIIFGAVAAVFERYYEKRTFIHFSLYLMFLQCVVRIFVRWQPYQFYYLMSFFFVLLICRGSKRIKLIIRRE